MPTCLIQNDQKSAWKHTGRAFLGGQPRHCISTNALHGLSAAAEFLVKILRDISQKMQFSYPMYLIPTLKGPPKML